MFDCIGVGCFVSVLKAARFNFLRSNPPWKSSFSFCLDNLLPVKISKSSLKTIVGKQARQLRQIKSYNLKTKVLLINGLSSNKLPHLVINTIQFFIV